MNTTITHPKKTTIIADLSTEPPPLLKEIKRALWGCGYPELKQISIRVDGCEVRLAGTVSSYFQKQLAQEQVKRLPGVTTLRNEIRVSS
jgi:osmotically-inducible protein OsmY